MITNKDIRVENGFLIINGDKYPLDGQSPEAIMQIVEHNSDTTPTENSDAPVTSGGIKTYVDNAILPIITDLKDFKNLFASSPTSTSVTYTFSIPANAIAELTAVLGTDLAKFYIIAAGTTLRVIKQTNDVTGLNVTLDSISGGVYNYTVTVPAFALSVAYRII